MPFHWIVDVGRKELPFTVNRNAALPAFTTDGLRDPKAGTGFDAALIVNSADPELPPPGDGFVTLTAAVPESEISAAGICACNCVLEVYVVVIEVPFH